MDNKCSAPVMKCLAHLIPIFLGSIITARKNCLNLYLKGDTQRPMLQLQWMPELLDHHASPRIFHARNNSILKYFSSRAFNPPFSYIISHLRNRVSQNNDPSGISQKQIHIQMKYPFVTMVISGHMWSLVVQGQAIQIISPTGPNWS